MKLECKAVVQASADFVFRVVHDYDLRLLWDPFLRRADVLHGAVGAGLGVQTHCAVKYNLLGWGMTTEYVSFHPGQVAAVKMTEGPFFFESFAASIKHRELGLGKSEITYQLNFRVLRGFPPLFTSLLGQVLHWETSKRLQALSVFCGPSEQSQNQMVSLRPDFQLRCPSPAEARFIYGEVFTDNCYLAPLPHLGERPLVVDVGSNIGLFATRVLEDYPQAQVVCIEPGLETYQALQSNLEGRSLSLHRLAVGQEEGILPFYYYPRAPGNSSLHRRELTEELVEKLHLAFRAVFPAWWRTLVPRPLFRLLAQLLWGRPAVTATPVFRLSTILKSFPGQPIDLLKIDVERGEREVLLGLDETDWERLRHLVVEVTSLDWGRGHLEGVVELLQDRGFAVDIHESELSQKARQAIEKKMKTDGRIDHLVFASRRVG